MSQKKKGSSLRKKIKFEPQYVIFFFSLLVLITFVIGFARPVYPAPLSQTIDPSCTPASDTPQTTNESEVTPTPTSLPPTPEEIGYTDGIIFWATILVVILLVGTLRETLRRKGE